MFPTYNLHIEILLFSSFIVTDTTSFFFLLLCFVSLQGVEETIMALHYLISLSLRKVCIYVIPSNPSPTKHLHKLFRLVIRCFNLLHLPSMYHVLFIFSNPSFLVICFIDFHCHFLALCMFPFCFHPLLNFLIAHMLSPWHCHHLSME